MKNNLKIAVIGAGYMSNEHIKAFKDIINVKVSGIYSRTYKNAACIASKYNIKFVCESIEELYYKTKANLVIIAVPELSVKSVCVEAFKYPWKCLIEKPVGYNLAEANEIVELAKNLNQEAYVALNRRHYSSTRSIKAEIDKSKSDRLVHVFDQENTKLARKNGWPKKVVDNWRYANSIHLVDYFQILCRGKLIKTENIMNWKFNKPCFVFAKLTYSSGDIGLYEAIWEGPGPWAVTVTTKEKYWELRPLEKAQSIDLNSRAFTSVEQDKWDIDFKPGLRKQAEEAIKAILNLPHSLPSLEESLKTTKIIEKIYGY